MKVRFVERVDCVRKRSRVPSDELAYVEKNVTGMQVSPSSSVGRALDF